MVLWSLYIDAVVRRHTQILIMYNPGAKLAVRSDLAEGQSQLLGGLV